MLRLYRIHVLVGSKEPNGNVQYQPFLNALGKLNLKTNYPHVRFEVKFLTAEDIRDLGWTPAQTVAWLLEADIHFVLCHVHQGLDALRWNMKDLEDQLMSLREHDGFPCKDYLKCPVFLQDKYAYLLSLVEMINNTLRITLAQNGEFEAEQLDKITSFFHANRTESGVIVKGPHTTGSHCIRYAKTSDELIAVLRRLSIANYGVLDYVIVQPMLEIATEMKLVFLNKTFSHITHYSKLRGHSIGTQAELVRFAEDAIHLLASRQVTSAWMDQLVRVDIMCTSDGRLVVNEIESIEAMFAGTVADDLRVTTFLTDYWFEKLDFYITKQLGASLGHAPSRISSMRSSSPVV